MKRLLSLAFFALFTFALWAQTVPLEVRQGLEIQFPGAKSVKWHDQEDEDEYEASLKWNKNRMIAKFDTKGNWLESEREIGKSKLPAAVSLSISIDFADYVIDSVELISTPKRKEAYEVSLLGEDHMLKVIFTAGGKVLEKDREALE